MPTPLSLTGTPSPLPLLPLADWSAASGAGVELAVTDDWAPLTGHIATLPLIAIRFAGFRDGRGFTLARRLRRAGFAGELRALGPLLPDQFSFLLLCGFDSVVPVAEADPALWQRAALALPASYQNDPTLPTRFAKPSIWASRHAAAAVTP